MWLAVDVDYRSDGSAKAVGVLFTDWSSDVIEASIVRRVDRVQPYRPGAFFEREFPPVLAVVEASPIRPAILIIDGYVTLGSDRRDGLGAHLFRTLRGEVPVIGVAKSRFRDTGAETEIRRGNSARPLFVTSIGIDADEAKELVRSMHGPHRIPTVLAAADRLCRTM